MSIYQLPVLPTDLDGLFGLMPMFIGPNPAAAEGQASVAINAATPGGLTVYSFAEQLLANNLSTAQVAMADTALIEGTAQVIQYGNTEASGVSALAAYFLPPQVANAIAHGLNPTVYAAEALGLALGGGPLAAQAYADVLHTVNTQTVNPVTQPASAADVQQFATQVASVTGVHVAPIIGWVQSWEAFYIANPAAHNGTSVIEAAFGAAFGDAIGVALLQAPGLTPLPTGSGGIGTYPTLHDAVTNALIDAGEGLYEPGQSLEHQPAHFQLQGEPPIVGQNEPPPPIILGQAAVADLHFV